MLFCRNCGVQLPDDSKFCANCGTAVLSMPTNANIHTVNNQTPPPTSERLLTNDGLCYEYERGKELEHFYCNSKTLKRYTKSIVYNVIIILFLAFIMFVCQLSIDDYLDDNILISNKVEKEIETAEFFINLGKIAIVILFIELIYHIIAKTVHRENVLHLCENGIYGKTVSFLMVKKFDIPYSKIDNVAPYSIKGMFPDEYLIVHMRTTDMKLRIRNIEDAIVEINKRLTK